MFKYFQLCTHEKKLNNDGGEKRIVRVINDGTQIDVLIRGATVLEIEELRVISYSEELDRRELVYDEPTGRYTYEDEDEDEGFYDDPKENFIRFSEYFPPGAALSNPIPADYYDPYVHNRIKWLVIPPTEYEVTIRVRLPKAKVERHDAKNCPDCQGKGWFVDILDNSGKFNVDRGIEKITQRFLKDLLTEIYSSKTDLEYGTMLRETLGYQTTNDEVLFDDIRMIISEVEDNYLVRQTEKASGLTPEETLRSCTITKIHRSPFDNRTIIIELKIQTESEVGNFRFVV